MSPTSAANLRFAQVVAVYPQRRTVEIVYCDDGWREADVSVLNWYVSSDTGGWSQHNVARPPDELSAGGLNPIPDSRTTLALVAKVAGRSVIMGYIPHPLTQMEFTIDQQDRDIWRHPSGTICTIAPNGSVELHHTGGAYVRIGTNSPLAAADQHEDLTPVCANMNWALPVNDPPTVTIVTKTFKATVLPGGDTTIESGGNLKVQYVGDAEIELGGSAKVLVGGSAYLSAGGDISVQTPASATVTAGGTATVQAVGDASLVAGGNVAVQAAGSASVDAGGDAQVAAGGSASLVAGASVTVAAGGDATIGAAGAVTVGSAGSMLLSAPDITADTGTFTVTGVIIEMDSFTGLISGSSVGAGIGSTGASEGAAGASAAGAAASHAPPVSAQASSDAQQARTDTQAAAHRADLASQAAVGTVARLQP